MQPDEYSANKDEPIIQPIVPNRIEENVQHDAYIVDYDDDIFDGLNSDDEEIGKIFYMLDEKLTAELIESVQRLTKNSLCSYLGINNVQSTPSDSAYNSLNKIRELLKEKLDRHQNLPKEKEELVWIETLKAIKSSVYTDTVQVT